MPGASSRVPNKGERISLAIHAKERSHLLRELHVAALIATLVLYCTFSIHPANAARSACTIEQGHALNLESWRHLCEEQGEKVYGCH